MKKILLFALTAFMAGGCSNTNKYNAYYIVTIDSCEYIKHLKVIFLFTNKIVNSVRNVISKKQKN